MCKNCLNYSKRLEKCKLKSDRITTNNQGKCIQFSKITNDILSKRKKQEKEVAKKKDAKYCIDCSKNQGGFCSLYNRWAFNVREICKETKGKVVKQ